MQASRGQRRSLRIRIFRASLRLQRPARSTTPTGSWTIRESRFGPADPTLTCAPRAKGAADLTCLIWLGRRPHRPVVRARCSVLAHRAPIGEYLRVRQGLCRRFLGRYVRAEPPCEEGAYYPIPGGRSPRRFDRWAAHRNRPLLAVHFHRGDHLLCKAQGRLGVKRVAEVHHEVGDPKLS
jgi:hypothetical protein